MGEGSIFFFFWGGGGGGGGGGKVLDEFDCLLLFCNFWGFFLCLLGIGFYFIYFILFELAVDKLFLGDLAALKKV